MRLCNQSTTHTHSQQHSWVEWRGRWKFPLLFSLPHPPLSHFGERNRWKFSFAPFLLLLAVMGKVFNFFLSFFPPYCRCCLPKNYLKNIFSLFFTVFHTHFAHSNSHLRSTYLPLKEEIKRIRLNWVCKIFMLKIFDIFEKKKTAHKQVAKRGCEIWGNATRK